jgi:hypothetical protein
MLSKVLDDFGVATKVMPESRIEDMEQITQEQQVSIKLLPNSTTKMDWCVIFIYYCMAIIRPPEMSAAK